MKVANAMRQLMTPTAFVPLANSVKTVNVKNLFLLVVIVTQTLKIQIIFVLLILGESFSKSFIVSWLMSLLLMMRQIIMLLN